MGAKTRKLSQINDSLIEWQSVVVADGSTGLTAVAGRGYFINTTGGSITVTFPANPKIGDTIIINDYASTFATNNVTINFNGNKLEADTTNATLSTNDQTHTFVFTDATQGWKIVNQDTGTSIQALFISATGGTVTTSGDYKIHTFTGDGCFVVATAGNPTGSNTVDYLVVAGGGGSGSGTGDAGGGGGAGGVRFYASPDITSYPASPRNGPASLPVSATTYPITVGAGGAGVATSGTPALKATSGSNSIFSTITSAGGGGGGGLANPRCSGTGANGGSGGGANGGFGPLSVAGGSGNTPPSSPSQGSAGGSGSSPGSPDNQGGAGGGFMAAGQNTTDSHPGAAAGGIGGGFPTSFVGSNGEPSGGYQYFSGGGGGGSNRPTVSPSPTGPGLGGLGGGGDNLSGSSEAGSANTGGGAGAAGITSPGPTIAGAAGGKGIVVIRYKFQ